MKKKHFFFELYRFGNRSDSEGEHNNDLFLMGSVRLEGHSLMDARVAWEFPGGLRVGRRRKLPKYAGKSGDSRERHCGAC